MISHSTQCYSMPLLLKKPTLTETQFLKMDFLKSHKCSSNPFSRTYHNNKRQRRVINANDTAVHSHHHLPQNLVHPKAIITAKSTRAFSNIYFLPYFNVRFVNVTTLLNLYRKIGQLYCM